MQLRAPTAQFEHSSQADSSAGKSGHVDGSDSGSSRARSPVEPSQGAIAIPNHDWVCAEYRERWTAKLQGLFSLSTVLRNVPAAV